ncbi:uncharacterized protein TNCV_1555601 [Trichonephila clavipes]|nr:uncharacterized protein TNCV_1555601 [Trichonephila clavipes]
MVLKTTANDRRHLALCHDEFRGPSSGFYRSVANDLRFLLDSEIYFVAFFDMASSRRCCVLNPDCFCYICGEYVFAKYRKPILDFVKTAYHQYFKIKLCNQDKLWVPHIVYQKCAVSLQLWSSEKRDAVMFETPMIWREPQNHHDDCYFCVVKINGINPGNRNKWSYPNLSSAQ